VARDADASPISVLPVAPADPGPGAGGPCQGYRRADHRVGRRVNHRYGAGVGIDDIDLAAVGQIGGSTSGLRGGTGVVLSVIVVPF
jgi:hypothetical protein